MLNPRNRALRTAAVLAALLVLFGPGGTAQTPAPGRETSAESVAKYPLDGLMPVDPDATLGTLPNGLRYYVRQNGRPANRIELRLVVKAGSVLEDPDQQGLAHFVEHMLFEGTRRFPGQGINAFLASMGLGIGADANAVTSYDDTQYSLRLPATPEALDRGLMLMADWAQSATFDPEAIERQRAIVLAEWRARLGAAERTQDKIRRVQLEGSRYAIRPPVGAPDIIEKAQREQLTRFYRDWYRPNLMAVIVVGDVPREATVALINSHFAALTNPQPARAREAFDVPERPGTRYAIVTDREATATAVSMSNLRPARRQDTVGGYRQIMRDGLFGEMLDARLDELTRRENPPFLGANAHRSLFPMPRTKDEAVLEALVAADGVPRGLEALVTELQRVIQYGFTATELERAKVARLRAYERGVTESPDRESSSRASEYTRNFLQGEALPTIWQELAFHRRFLPEITLAEMNALAADWFPPQNRLVVVAAPETGGITPPTEAQLAAAVKNATSRRLEAYVDEATAAQLMDVPPRAGTIVRTTARPEAGITEWTLSNGARVVLKPTTLREDQILFRATAPGGLSLAADADFPAVRVADQVVAAGGVGRFSAAALDRMLTGKAVAVSAFIGELEQGVGGGGTPEDLETMFQLLHLRFTQPRADPGAFAAFVSQAKGLLANQQASPDVVFNQTIDAELSANHPRRRPLTLASADAFDLTKSMAFYKARFADAGNFTFVFVGSFTPELLKPLVETYVASLPSTPATETWRDVGVPQPRGVVERTVQQGIAPRSQVAIVFSGPFVYDDANILALRAMTLVLESRLFDTIRQELGGTYSISASPGTQRYPQPAYTVRIQWACDPARTEALVKRVFDEINFVRDSTYSPAQMTRIRAALLRNHEQQSQSNGYVLSEVARVYALGQADRMAAMLDVPARIEGLTGEALQRAAQTYLDTRNFVKVTQVPQPQ